MKILLTEEQFQNIPNSKPYLTDEKFELLKKFIVSCKKELQLDNKLTFKFKSKRDGELSTYAHYSPSEKKICVYIKNRSLGDILRSIAHELKHAQQDFNGELTADSGKDGSPHENEANSFAGVMLRKFGREFPMIFESVNNKKLI